MIQWTTTIQSNIIVLLFLPLKFGKGIYFADMSSKSANYCFANQKNDQGLLMLSKVVFLYLNIKRSAPTSWIFW